jgi:hypothetical protein
MDIDRRQALIGGAGVALAGLLKAVHAGPDPRPPGILDNVEWHPLTRSLLERAREIGVVSNAPERAMVERTIRQFADASGSVKPPVIKWLDTPADAFDQGCAPIDSRLDTAKICSDGRVHVDHAELPEVFGGGKTFSHGLGRVEMWRGSVR